MFAQQLIDLEAKYMACMWYEPRLIDQTSLSPSFMTYGFDEVFKYFIQCRAKGEYPSPEGYALTNNKSLPYLDEILNEYTKDSIEGFVSNFENHEKTMIELLKDEKMHSLMDEFQKGKIDRATFRKRADDIESVSVIENHKATSQSGIKALTTNKRIIKTNDYDTLSDALRLEPKSFVLISAGTGIGKSAFAINMLEAYSKEYPCIYFNMEMGDSMWYTRVASVHNNIAVAELQDNFEDHMDCLDFLDDRNIDVYHHSMTIDDCKRILARKSGDEHFFAFFDNVSNIKLNSSSQYEKLTQIALELRDMALQYNCTIFGLCQQSRPNEKVKIFKTSDGLEVIEKPKPELGKMRDSGELEQSASHILLLYEQYDKTYEKLVYKIEIAKARGAAPGTVIEAYFDKTTQIITELA